MHQAFRHACYLILLFMVQNKKRSDIYKFRYMHNTIVYYFKSVSGIKLIEAYNVHVSPPNVTPL